MLLRSKAISPLFHNILVFLRDFHVKTGIGISLRDKQLFEINEVEITRVGCIDRSTSRGLLARLLGVIGRLCSVIVAFPGHCFYYFRNFKRIKRLLGVVGGWVCV